MIGWMKSLAAAACLLTVFLHLIPENRFAKYVRFYAGLLFFMLAAQPVLELLGSADELERFLQLEFLKDEYYDLESAAEGLDELKNEQIQKAYQKELERQAAGILSAYGLTAVEVEIVFGEDEYSVERVYVLAEATQTEDGDSAANSVGASGSAVRELAELYLIAESDIAIDFLNE